MDVAEETAVKCIAACSDTDTDADSADGDASGCDVTDDRLSGSHGDIAAAGPGVHSNDDCDGGQCGQCDDQDIDFGQNSTSGNQPSFCQVFTGPNSACARFTKLACLHRPQRSTD